MGTQPNRVLHADIADIRVLQRDYYRAPDQSRDFVTAQKIKRKTDIYDRENLYFTTPEQFTWHYAKVHEHEARRRAYLDEVERMKLDRSRKTAQAQRAHFRAVQAQNKTYSEYFTRKIRQHVESKQGSPVPSKALAAFTPVRTPARSCPGTPSRGFRPTPTSTPMMTPASTRTGVHSGRPALRASESRSLATPSVASGVSRPPGLPTSSPTCFFHRGSYQTEMELYPNTSITAVLAAEAQHEAKGLEDVGATAVLPTLRNNFVQEAAVSVKVDLGAQADVLALDLFDQQLQQLSGLSREAEIRRRLKMAGDYEEHAKLQLQKQNSRRFSRLHTNKDMQMQLLPAGPASPLRSPPKSPPKSPALSKQNSFARLQACQPSFGRSPERV